MFGLFDTPPVKIKKRIPSRFHRAYELVEIEIQSRLPYYTTTDTENGLLIGFALCAWALNEHREGRMTVSNYDGLYISNYGQNCGRMLKYKRYLAVELVNSLRSDGVIYSDETTDHLE